MPSVTVTSFLLIVYPGTPRYVPHQHCHHQSGKGGIGRGPGETNYVIFAEPFLFFANVARQIRDNPSDSNFVFILGNASHGHIMALREFFEKRYGKNLVDFIKKNTSGDFEDFLVLLGKFFVL